jgi:hypothetical protein
MQKEKSGVAALGGVLGVFFLEELEAGEEKVLVFFLN